MARQLPVYSPLPLASLLRSVGAGRGSRSALRERLAARFGADPGAVLLAKTGTQALGLAMAMVGRKGDPAAIALPAYTCWDVGTAARWAGVRAAFYDVDPHDLTPALPSFEAALARGVAAAVVSPLHGYPVDWDALRSLCRARGALLIEDAAQGHGSRWKGRPVGSFGDLSVLSFGRGKGWTGAGGGALLVRSEEVSEAALELRARGGRDSHLTWAARAVAQALLGRPALYGLPAALPGAHLGETRYRPPRDPAAMSPRMAALILSTEGPADEEAERRRRAGEALLRRLGSGDASGVGLVRPSGPGAGFLRLPVRIPHADASWERMARRLGVERGYPLALPDVPELHSLDPNPSGDLPGARLLARELFTVPTHSLLRATELERIATLLSAP